MSATAPTFVPLSPRHFIFAGNATFTIRSIATGNRYTYKVVKADPKPGVAETWFVKRLFGSNNENDYRYAGFVRDGQFVLGRNSSADDPSVKAVAWYLACILAGKEPPKVEFAHAGRCGRCGRLLTVPESIASGFGPECLARIHEG